MITLLVGAAVLGGAIGSFLNVVVWRLPRGESLVRPRSRCPQCETPIRPHHNVPVLSWLALRGRCATCHAPIPARYPLVEALTAALYVAVVAATGADREAIVGLLLVSVLVPIAFIDLDHRRIPNKITGPAAVAAVAATLLLQPGELGERLLSGLIAGGVFGAVALAMPGGMGMGDAKLAGVLGLFLGRAVAPALFLAFAAGSAVGLVIAGRRGMAGARKTTIPFGPFLAAGGVVGLLAGTQLIGWYAGTFV
ncbi:MAG TPA: prepilin peptidase [Solirubrobacteraceae bacterium]|jgi:leader peptidase (prepilin peptidase)/N-methyltransferase